MGVGAYLSYTLYQAFHVHQAAGHSCEKTGSDKLSEYVHVHIP